MFQSLPFLLASLTLTSHYALAYPSVDVSRRQDDFVFGSIGDSWGSGVQWDKDTAYDGNEDSCMRYKYAWSTVIRDQYASWTPAQGARPQFEFKACSGAHLNDMTTQLDKMTRPKLVFMEAGGNNANFYPMADSCLFHATFNKTFGTHYEKDDPSNPTGECRREIKLVRDRLSGDNMKKQVIETIHKWRSHKSVVGNDATLVLLGYGRFFALGSECDAWSFGVLWDLDGQLVTRPMREEFNELVSEMNRAIREAAESFNDHRIQYVDVDPGFQGHRFCEPGDIQETQFNKNSKVWFWNQPTKWYVTIFDGDKSTTYDDDKAPSDILLKLIGFPVKTEKLGDEDVYVFHNPDFPQLTMEFRARVDGSDLDTQNGGKIARTLHPTQDGHKAMGDIVSKWLAIYHGRTSGPIQLPGSCPAGCKCNGIVPVCT